MKSKHVIVTTFALAMPWLSPLRAAEIELKPERWKFAGENIAVGEHLGRRCIHFKGNGGREAYLTDCEFTDGEIRFKAAGSMFIGCIFRVRDGTTYEGVYFRPENSRHADPQKRKHAAQYIAHPKYTWQYLRKNFPEKYEASADIPTNEWFDVRIVVSGKRAEVFVNDGASPCLVVEELLHGESSGSVGFFVDSGREGWFADLRIAPVEGKR